MSMKELLDKAEFLVDADGNKKAVVFDMAMWEELLSLLEELEDAAEIQRMRDGGEELIDWAQAKKDLRKSGIDV